MSRCCRLQFAKKTGDLPFLSKTDLRVSPTIRHVSRSPHEGLWQRWCGVADCTQVIALTYQLEREANGAANYLPCSAQLHPPAVRS